MIWVVSQTQRTETPVMIVRITVTLPVKPEQISVFFFG